VNNTEHSYQSLLYLEEGYFSTVIFDIEMCAHHRAPIFPYPFELRSESRGVTLQIPGGKIYGGFQYSSAPMSGAGPCGRRSPSKSVGG
jgi:hypothetical protein